MKETDTIQSTAPDGISSTFKIFLFVIPSTLAQMLFPHGHWALFGVSFILGTLLQALWPPRTYKLPLILGLAIAAAVAIPVTARFAGWN
ncbi:MAG TPA: hypothetical protein VK828_04085 [Terriglobales bacterium]|nr:hypothetical protein [Terriglobales bacterium]